MSTLFSGVYTALITPFLEDGTIDYHSLEHIIENQIAAHVNGLLVLGTTGESPTITFQERNELIRFVVRAVQKRVRVIAGTGCNDTASTLRLSYAASNSGADALLLVNPYYNKPTQQGLYQHFRAVADTIDTPQILYNIQGRTAVNLATSTFLKLAQHRNIVGVKEASSNLSQIMEVIDGAPEDFSVLSGDDALTYPLICLGGHGVISVVSHLVPNEMVQMVSAALGGDYSTAQKIHFELLPLITGCFLETNPIPVKTALFLQGRIQNIFRSPLCQMSSGILEQWKTTLRNYNLCDPADNFSTPCDTILCAH